MLYDDQDNADADYEVLDVSEFDKPTSLSESIKVVIQILNNNYLEDCLLNILINFVNKNTNPLLRDNFFPELRIQELTDLHMNLREDLKFVEVDFKKIGEVFNKYEADFLKYCPVVAKMKTLTEFFKDKMSHNEDVINEVNSLKEESMKSGVNKRLKEDLLDLIQRIPQAIMRFPMALEDVAKQAIKSEQPLVEREAKKAHETMKRVMKHIDAYSRDYKNIELVENMQREMDCRRLKECGLLFYEVDDVGIWFKCHDQKKFPKHKLLVFEEVIAIFERREIKKVAKRADGSVKMSTWGEPVMNVHVKYFFLRTFNISKFSEISKVLNHTNNLALNNYLEGARLDKDYSFEIEFSTEEGRQTFENNLHERQRITSNLNNAKSGSNHHGHIFRKFQNSITYRNQVDIEVFHQIHGQQNNFQDDDHLKCSQCEQYLGGKILTAIFCETCNKYYHLNCFELDDDDAEEEEEEHLNEDERGNNQT